MSVPVLIFAAWLLADVFLIAGMLIAPTVTRRIDEHRRMREMEWELQVMILAEQIRAGSR
jgi:hypothetical protein